MITYACYDITGDILWMVQDPPVEELENASDEYYYIECPADIHPDLYWVDIGNNNEIRKCTKFPIEVSVANNKITFKKVPHLTEIIWPDGYCEKVTESTVVTDAIYPGKYVFKLNHPKHLIEELVVNV